MPIPKPWLTRAEFEAWWMANVIEFNRLAVDDPEQWGRIACVIEEFQTGLPGSSAPPERFPPVTVW